ncbi:hypothetical protein Tco_0905318 [Tanacetum coccineum]
MWYPLQIRDTILVSAIGLLIPWNSVPRRYQDHTLKDFPTTSGLLDLALSGEDLGKLRLVEVGLAIERWHGLTNEDTARVGKWRE